MQFTSQASATTSFTAPLLLCLFFLRLVSSATVEYDFDLGWVWANPDNAHPRSVIGVNGQWPLPIIRATVGDTVIVNVQNGLGNQSASIHFHGLFMNGTTHMDGTSYVSQCSITPGARFIYKFVVDQPGTYWYHSHEQSQYPDGLRGMFIVYDLDHPYHPGYDDELIISLSDWYHDPMPALLTTYDVPGEHLSPDPAPKSNLINDAFEPKIKVEPGRTYLIHLANIGAFVGQYFWIEQHTFTVVEADGVYTQAKNHSMLYLAAGQRYSVLLTTKDAAGTNFPMLSRMDEVRQSWPLSTTKY
jgi:iron transport multicopper oxidase